MAAGASAQYVNMAWLLLMLLPSASAFGRLFQTLFNKTTSTDSSPCKDDAKDCAEWAADGECMANRMCQRRRALSLPTTCSRTSMILLRDRLTFAGNTAGFMLASCAKSCVQCNGQPFVSRKPKLNRGCVDEEGYECERRAKAGECDSDIGEMLSRCPSSCHVCAYTSLLQDALGCEDSHDSCGNWARQGECNANPQFMMESCSRSCDQCATKRQSCNRPPDTPPAVVAGGINATMSRILRDFQQYKPTALSWPGGPKGAKAPWVLTLENFIRDDEIEAFKTSCASQFQRSLAGDQLSPVRTSQQVGSLD